MLTAARSCGISAAIYTQITDVEAELNGFWTYDRQIAKFDTARVRAANQQLIAASNTDQANAYLRKQLVNVAIGLVLMVMVMATDHRWVRILAPLVYLGSIVGLVGVLVAGSTINGSRSWLQVGGMSIQPSEFAKLAVVLWIANLYARRPPATPRQMILPMVPVTATARSLPLRTCSSSPIVAANTKSISPPIAPLQK